MKTMTTNIEHATQHAFIQGDVFLPKYQHEDVEVIFPELRVKVRGKLVHFTLMELRLLLVFLERPCEQISSDELIRRLDLTSPNALFTLIYAVRKLLDQQYIHSCRGRGFRFARTDLRGDR